MKKITKSCIVLITILFLLAPSSFGFLGFGEKKDNNLKEHIKKEDGSLFEKIIAECIRRNCTNSFRF